ncbi:sigma-70 family RNA polymerase sigma factor [Candidatus Poribacteria bacterium]|nr:sigma-70 family RNA polymerase sigma factor [Candidatus Poribacteria bacterium]
MKKNDIELIRLTLDGDEAAFTELVNRYKKAVHALVWRKIEDFHIAEELTQDVFLKAYQKLESLKKPQSFASWLYVSASRRCIAWQRKKRLPTIPFDETKSAQHQETAYSQYVVEENQRISEETQRDVVKQLLAKLPESERTVITLHYFSDMSSFEIGTFLGVSANTVRSRLRRAQKRLQKEEPMIREALEHFQISPNITDNIMREVSHLKPTPSGSKPIIPWIVAASSAVIIALVLGIGSQFLAHFQKPYSLDAQAETEIELVDSSLVLNLEKAADTRNQIGRANVLNSNNINGQKQEDESFAAAQDDGVDVSKRKQQWISETPINGSPVYNLLATPEGEIYALGEDLYFYKFSADGREWELLCDLSALPTTWSTNVPMTKWKNTLYILPSNQLFASENDGKTWDLRHTWEEHYGPNEVIGTEQALYVAFSDGIFRTEDDGKTWKAMNDGLNERLVTLIEFQNILFAGTEYGLFRLNGDSWERLNLPDPVLVNIRSLAAAEEKLYVATEFSFEAMRRPGFVDRGPKVDWRIYRSVDLGDSWTDITPTDTWSQEARPPGITLLAAGETLIVIGQGMVRSTDGGDTWLPPSPDFSKDYFSPALALNESLFYVEGQDGLHRSTDQGNTWHKVNIPQEREQSPIADLIVQSGNDTERDMHPTVFARYGIDYKRPAGLIAETKDKGNSWQNIQMDLTQNTDFGTQQPTITHIVKSNGDIYAKGGDIHGGINKANIYGVSQDDKTLAPVQEIPIIDGSIMAMFYQHTKYAGVQNDYLQQEEKKMQENSFGAEQFFKQLTEIDKMQLSRFDTRRAILDLFWRGFWGPFAIGNDTFYMEYNFKLFRWMPGETEWYDTGLEETVELTLDTIRKDLILAVSGDTVYVGKRDGHLVVSFDKGNNWTDLTPALPFHVDTFKDIVVDGMKAYVATDAGIIRTDDGRNWHTVTDSEGVNLIMEHLAVDESVLYGVTGHSGIYRLENGSWKQVVSNTPESVTSLAVSGDTIYVGTAYNEMLHYILEE